MSSTLRDEILKVLNDYFYDIVSPPPATDEILKLIEKRIDSVRLPQIENGIYTKPQLEYLAVCIMEDVKREILK
jgi:hypothetical protein